MHWFKYALLPAAILGIALFLLPAQDAGAVKVEFTGYVGPIVGLNAETTVDLTFTLTWEEGDPSPTHYTVGGTVGTGDSNWASVTLTSEMQSTNASVTIPSSPFMINQCVEQGGLLRSTWAVTASSGTTRGEVWRECTVLHAPSIVPPPPAVCGEELELGKQTDPSVSQVPQDSGRINGLRTITYQPVHPYIFPAGTITTFTFTDPCIPVTPLVPHVTEQCGSNNDLVGIPAQEEGVMVNDTGWVDNVRAITFSTKGNYIIPEGVQTSFTYTDAGECLVDPVVPKLIHAVCGDDNDIYSEPTQPDNVTMTDSGWSGNERTFTFSAAADYALPDGFEAAQNVADAGVPCPTDTPVPPIQTEICGPDNDIITIPSQPKGITVEDSGWVENERTIAFIPAEGYAITEGAQTRITFSDDNIPCEVDPVGTTLVLRFETSDGGSLEGEAFRFYAPVASQQAGEPFIEGEIGVGNVVVLKEIIAGTYRIAVSPEGYEPIDELITVTAESATEEHVIEVQAIQPVETPTPSPTVAPTAEPTAEPTQPAVTGLPATGSGPGVGFGWISVALIALVLLAAGVRRSEKL